MTDANESTGDSGDLGAKAKSGLDKVRTTALDSFEKAKEGAQSVKVGQQRKKLYRDLGEAYYRGRSGGNDVTAELDRIVAEIEALGDGDSPVN